MACPASYYKLKSATAWTQAYKIAITSYNLSATNQLLEQTMTRCTAMTSRCV